MIRTFRDVIDLWPSAAELALAIGTSAEAVKKWRQRNSIPAEWWMSIVKSAPGGAHVTADVLASLASRDLREAAE